MPVPDFLSGYNQQIDRNQRTTANDIQNASGAMGVLAKLQHQKQQEQVNSIINNAPSMEAALAELPKAGPLGIKVAQQIAQLQEQKTKAGETQRKAAFYSPQNMAQFQDEGRPAIPQPAAELGGGPPAPAEPGRLNLDRMTEAAAMQGIVNPETLANHRATQQTARDRIAQMAQDKAAELQRKKDQDQWLAMIAGGNLANKQANTQYNTGMAPGAPVLPGAPALVTPPGNPRMPTPPGFPSVTPAEQAARDADAQRIRLAEAGGGAGLPPTSAVVAPEGPVMPPQIASAPKRVQDRWLLQQMKPSIAGAGTLTPETLEFVAKQYLTGDRQVVQGFARSATTRIALQNAIVDEAAKQGMSPEATAAKIAEFAGTVAGSRTVGQRAASISLAATEAQDMLVIVKEKSDEFKRTRFVPFNIALKAFESNTGSPEIAAFGASLNALVNVYARAINPTGVPTISDKDHAREVLNAVQSPAQVDAVLGIIRRELEIAKQAPASVTKATTQRITGGTAAKPSVDSLLEKYK